MNLVGLVPWPSHFPRLKPSTRLALDSSLLKNGMMPTRPAPTCVPSRGTDPTTPTVLPWKHDAVPNGVAGPPLKLKTFQRWGTPSQNPTAHTAVRPKPWFAQTRPAPVRVPSRGPNPTTQSPAKLAPTPVLRSPCLMKLIISSGGLGRDEMNSASSKMATKHKN